MMIEKRYIIHTSNLIQLYVTRSPILRTTITVERLQKRDYESLFSYYIKISPFLNEPLYTRTALQWCERLSPSVNYRQGSLLDYAFGCFLYFIFFLHIKFCRLSLVSLIFPFHPTLTHNVKHLVYIPDRVALSACYGFVIFYF